MLYWLPRILLILPGAGACWLQAQAPAHCPQASLLSAYVCDSASLNLASLVRDYSGHATRATYYQTDPAQPGAQPFASTSMLNGQAVPQPPVLVHIDRTRTFWVVLSNDTLVPICRDTASLRVLQRQKPLLSLSPASPLCPGDTFSTPIYSSSHPSSLFFWEYQGGPTATLGLGGGKLPPYVTGPHTGPGMGVDSFWVYAWLNGCLSDTIRYQVPIKPAPRLASVPPDTLCSGEAFAVSLRSEPFHPATLFQLENPDGNALLSANTLWDSLYHPGAGLLSRQYRIIPRTDGCSGDTGRIIREIRPAPVLNLPPPDTVCSGTPWTFTFTQPANTGTIGLRWQMLSPDSNLRFRASSGNGPVLRDTLANLGGAPLPVLYEIVPESPFGCKGLKDTTVAVIQPRGALLPMDTLVSCANSQGLASFVLQGRGTLYTDPFLLEPLPPTHTLLSPDDTLYQVVASPGSCPQVKPLWLRAVPLPSPPGLASEYRVCDNEALEIGPGGGNYNFYPSASLDSTSALALGVSALQIPAASSPAEVFVTRSVLGCESAPRSAPVRLLASPVITASSNSPVCENQTLRLDADGAFLYVWTGPQNFFSTFEDPLLSGATVDLSGRYRVIGVNNFGCKDTAFAQVEVETVPYAGRDTSITVCRLDPAFDLFDILGGDPDSGGLWAGPQVLGGGYRGRFNPQTQTGGNYIYSITTPAPCSSTQYAVVRLTVVDSLQARIRGDSLAPLGGSIRLRGSGGISYAWTGPMGFSSSIPSPTLATPDSNRSGTYRLVVSTPGGCTDTAWWQVRVKDTTSLFLDARVGLQGAYDPATGLMHDFLRSRGFLPRREPFTTAGLVHGFPGMEIDSAFYSQPGRDAPVDWVYVELRDPAQPDSLIQAVPGVVRSDGKVTGPDGTESLRFDGLGTAPYRIVIRHRNHLGVISGQAIPLSWRQTAVADFTDLQFPVSGDPHARWVQGGKAWLFAGDANADGEIQVVDDLFIWNPQVGQAGYLQADYNLDGEVQNSDRLYLWAPNVGRGTFVP